MTPLQLRPDKRRWTRVGAAVLAVALSLTACSSGDASSDGGPVTLRFWTWSLKGTDPAAKAIVDK
jgi:multiple sugar transport system substrate-binding protein